jgi:hypothetical protein
MFNWTNVLKLFVCSQLSIFEARSFVCIYEFHRTPDASDASDCVFLVSLESSQPGGVHGLGSMTFGLAVQKFLNIE